MQKFIKDRAWLAVGEQFKWTDRGYDLIATIVRDHEATPDDDDMHNLDRSVTGANDEEQKRIVAARLAWENGRWHYYGVGVTVSRCGVELAEHSTWGLEGNYPGYSAQMIPQTDNTYFNEVIDEVADEAMNEAEQWIQKLLRSMLGIKP